MRPPSTDRPAHPPAPTAEGERPAPSIPLPEAIARCVARSRASLPPEVAGAIDVIGLASLLEDGCRLDAAPRLRDPSLCDAITSSAAREACGVRAAVASSAPDRCPSTPGLVGRDPVCVALASHDPSLCGAAPGSDRARCIALSRADARLCARVEAPFRDGCARDLAALAPWLSPRQGDSAPECEVTLDEITPGLDAAARSWRLLAHRRGAWLDDHGALWLLDPASGWPRPTAFAGDEPLVAVRVETARAARGAEIAAEVRVVLPDALPLDTRDASARATATFARIPRRRGDRYAVTVRIEGARAGLSRALSLHAEGFVRDVTPASALRAW